MARQGAAGLEEIIKNRVAIFRRWKLTKHNKRCPKMSFQFSVMTYNILSQTAVENHRYLYRHCSNTFLQEDYRISKILPEILSSRSDIICLQEVEQHVFDNRIKQLFHTKGFESIFKRRTNDKSDGCAILWRREKFNLLKHFEVEFQAKGNKFLNRDNVGLIAVLKPNDINSGDTQLHVATTHLLFNPKRGEVKLCQLRLLLAELERSALKEVNEEERVYHPIILCGDFNIQPHSPLYSFIESGAINIANTLSGDWSGQAEGKNKGYKLNAKQLSLHKLGINKASRYENNIENYDESLISNSIDGLNKSLEKDSSINGLPNNKLVDPNLMAAVGESSDPRWLQTLKAMGQEQLASELASRINQTQNNCGEFKPSFNDLSNSSNPCEVKPNTDEITFSHDFKFIPAYKYSLGDGRDIPISSMTGNDFNTVDHIFYDVKNKINSNTFSEGKLRLLGLYSLMRKDEIIDIGGLPNAHLGSDHLSLIAQFGLCFKR